MQIDRIVFGTSENSISRDTIEDVENAVDNNLATVEEPPKIFIYEKPDGVFLRLSFTVEKDLEENLADGRVDIETVELDIETSFTTKTKIDANVIVDKTNIYIDTTVHAIKLSVLDTAETIVRRAIGTSNNLADYSITLHGEVDTE